MAEKYWGAATKRHSNSNCKLTEVDYISSAYQMFGNTKEAKIASAKEFLSGCRMVTTFNTISEPIAEFFQDNFELYAINKVPAGYHGGYQWHIILKNTYSKHGTGYLRNIEKPEATGKFDNLTQLEQVLTKTLKAKRRKTDIVKDIIDQLK